MTDISQHFSLALYRPHLGLADKLKLSPVEFQIYTDNLNEHIDPVLGALPSQVLDYGHLFTYCFRRFGYPNWGSDSYKDIAQWFLTTPNPDLVLCIRPSVLPEPHFSIHFLTSPELGEAARNWERLDVDAWTERKLDWLEAQGLPDWMPELLASFREQFSWLDATWRDVYRSYIAMFTPREDSSVKLDGGRDQTEDQKQLTSFAVMVDAYKAIEPRPAFRKRNQDISQWVSDDPLEPLARAAIEALGDLATGVRVRDAAINAYGVLPYDAYVDVVDEPAVAGLGVADMINVAPEESVEIYQLARRLGDGDMKIGLSKLLKLAQADESQISQ
jgi:hypothetical protein